MNSKSEYLVDLIFKKLKSYNDKEILLEKELSNFNSIHKIIQILSNKKKLELMQKNCKKISKPEATMKIVDQVMMLIK